MRFNRYSLSFLGCLAAVILSVIILDTNAQTFDRAPRAMFFPAFYSNKTSFFIQGGFFSFVNPIAANQFYHLDLSVNWTTDKPAWRDLKSLDSPTVAYAGGLLPGGEFISATQDTDNLMSLVSNSGSNSWSPVRSAFTKIEFDGRHIVTMPSGAIFYGSAIDQFIIKSIREPIITELIHEKLLASSWTDAIGKGAIISLVYTEKDKDKGPTFSVEFLDPDSLSQGWKVMPVRGVTPSPQVIPCFVKSVDGDKIYYFGTMIGNDVLSYLHELDVKKRTWRKVSEVTMRIGPACVATRHSFIV